LIVAASRLVFAVLGGVAGYEAALLNKRGSLIPMPSRFWEILVISLFVLVGVVIGALIGGPLGRLARRMVVKLDERIATHSGAEMLVVFAGLIIGLGMAALFGLAVQRLPVVGIYLLIPLSIIGGYVGAHVAQRKHNDILRLLGLKVTRALGSGESPKLLDSSALIDGRVVDIVKAGFLDADLLIPSFVVEELQRVADSSDPDKRVRGRRGLDYVRKLQDVTVRAQVLDSDFGDLQDVDAKLVRLATLHSAAIVTTDYNLNKVARIQRVPVLNVNELANAVKSPVLPGEEIEVKILREGREHHQGVGYLDDGTMIVVEDGKALVGATVKAEVTSVLQSSSGKMIFARTQR
jgi:uncharacterized protein YacL